MPAAEEAVMRTIPLVLITVVPLSLSPTAGRAGANGSWCANYGTGLDGSINCSYTSSSNAARRQIRTPERAMGEAGGNDEEMFPVDRRYLRWAANVTIRSR